MTTMKRVSSAIAATVLAFGLSGVAAADSVEEVWQCTLEDDKTIDDVLEANSKWLAHVRENFSEEINSSVVVTIVGPQEGFLFVDSFPDLATWQKTKTGLRDNEEMQALFDGINECSRNTLYGRRQTP